MDNLNYIQMSILRELLFKPNSTFSNLNVLKISSDQFAYHIRTLLGYKLIEKNKNTYSLTTNGKETANRMDVEVNQFEKQPKVSMLIIPIKKFKGITKYLIQTRLKEPYYGYKGFMTGKIRYGETIEEGAARELFEETGLTAKFKHQFVIHEMVYSKKTEEILEDKFFNIIEATHVKGKLKNEQGTDNHWLNEEEFRASGPLYHNELEIFANYLKGNKVFFEKKYYIEKF